jgi:radical SAM protein with 4Fe4S-binding SPASM domain
MVPGSQMKKYKYDVEAHKALKQAKNFCPAPFTGLYEEPDGLVKPCCVYRGPDIGNVNDTSYEDLYNSPQMKSMRKDFKENKRPASCGACFNHIAEDDEVSMAVNRRAAFSQTHSWQQALDNTSDDGTISELKLEFYDVVSSNECNFACIGCSPVLSSTIAQQYYHEFVMLNRPDGDEPELWQKYEGKILGRSENHNKKRLELLRKNRENIVSLHLNGGEPFINQTAFDMLEVMAEREDDNFEIWSHTNGSMRKHTVVEEYLKNVKGNIRVAMSIDHHGARGEYMRYGFREKKWLEVRDRLKKLVYVAYSPCVTFMNLLTMDSFLDWMKDNGINKGKDVGWLFYQDTDINITMFKDTPLQARAEQMLELLDEEKVSEFYYGSKKYGDPSRLMRVLRSLDKKRGTSVEETFPELEYFINGGT